MKCPAYKAFPTGVEGGASDPCNPAEAFQLSMIADPSCTLKCKAGYEQKGGSGKSTLQCGKDGKLSGALTCTGELIYVARTNALLLCVACLTSCLL